MSDPNFWSIVSVALAFTVTLIGGLIALLAYGHHRRQAVRFWEREQRLPDATRLANLKVQIEELKEEYDTLKDKSGRFLARSKDSPYDVAQQASNLSLPTRKSMV